MIPTGPALALAVALLGTPLSEPAAAGASGGIEYRVTKPPPDRGFSPVYVKYIEVRGFPIVASGRVSDYALFEAAFLVDRMLGDRPDLIKALAEKKVRVVVMAATERTTDVPEHSDLMPKDYWDRRARGLGATRRRPAVSCGEENLLGFKGDPYVGENIFIHEFSHTIHEMGLRTVDPTFDDRLKAAYEAALARGLWKKTYAATNRNEYWAEGVQSWFDTNRHDDRSHNHVDTREELEAYDPDLARLVAEVFGKREWRYSRPDRRKEKGHLAGYDAAKSPTFDWRKTKPEAPAEPRDP
jgi:hypothetical protein